MALKLSLRLEENLQDQILFGETNDLKQKLMELHC